MNGDSETGVTTFLIQEKVDTGNIYLQEMVSIHPGETAGELHDRLAVVGANLLVRTLDLMENNQIKPFVQEGETSKAPKIRPEHGLIDWNKSAESIVNQIRGLSPYPGAYSFLKGARIKLYLARQVAKESILNKKPGTVVSADRDGLVVQTGKGCIAFLEIQKEGKRRMPIDAFLRGQEIATGIELSSTL
jgi:methionyl-tRNA formyltransferase